MDIDSFNGWERVLPFTSIQKANELADRVQFLRDEGGSIFPAQNNLFKALQLTSPEKTRVVILGQDPYHGLGQAHGLAFSIRDKVPKPPSLRNILAELADDLCIPVPESGDLTHWAKQGVLLLNTVLSVEEGKANSHKGLGWQEFTSAVLWACRELPQPVVYILWGGEARATCAGLLINRCDNKLAISSAHPSPLSAYRGFFGSKPFSQANRFLVQTGGKPIRW